MGRKKHVTKALLRTNPLIVWTSVSICYVHSTYAAKTYLRRCARWGYNFNLTGRFGSVSKVVVFNNKNRLIKDNLKTYQIEIGPIVLESGKLEKGSLEAT